MVLVYLQLCNFCFEGFSFPHCALDRMCYYIVALPVPPIYLFIYLSFIVFCRCCTTARFIVSLIAS